MDFTFDSMFMCYRYCRFFEEIKSGISRGGTLTLPTAQPANFALVPPGCFDAGDGYFHPKRMAIYDYKSGEEVRVVHSEEKDWILANCRHVPE